MRVLIDRPEDPDYETERKTFNRRFSKRPAAIVFCTTTEQVAHIVKVARENPEYPLRVKSGGHDHEAECSKTDAIVIDFKEMKDARHFPQTSGSFISFKDSSIPTHQYFMESYERLKQIKKTLSEDPDNIFSSRKTIL